MVLATRPASLFSSRSLSLLTSFSRPSPSHWRTALRSSGHPGVLNRTTAFRTETIGSSFSRRLLTTQHEKVKVLAILYDGGKHAEEVRARPLLAVFFSISLLPPYLPLACPCCSQSGALQLQDLPHGSVTSGCGVPWSGLRQGSRTAGRWFGEFGEVGMPASDQRPGGYPRLGGVFGIAPGEC
jgi:hypothetical protein